MGMGVPLGDPASGVSMQYLKNGVDVAGRPLRFTNPAEEVRISRRVAG